VYAINTCQQAGLSAAYWQFGADSATVCKRSDDSDVRTANTNSKSGSSESPGGNKRERTVKFPKHSAAAAGSVLLDVATLEKPN